MVIFDFLMIIELLYIILAEEISVSYRYMAFVSIGFRLKKL